MTYIYSINRVYTSFLNSSECAFGDKFDLLPLSENLPADFRKCVEEMLAAMRRAKRIADITIANFEVIKKQKELKEAENKLKDLESSDPKNQVSAN